MKIGRNMWNRPLIATGVTPSTKRKYLEINPGGHWFSALWVFGRELILAFDILLFCGTAHWHVDWGWKPQIKKIITTKADVARWFYAEIDAEWERAVKEYERQTGEAFPCAPGCADCCKASDATGTFRETPLSEAEAALLWETLVALPPDVQALLLERERTYHTATCILLSDEGLCLAYEGRPLWCRTWGLSGLPTCGKVKRVRNERWSEAVREAHAKLRGDGAFVPLRDVVKRLEKEIANADHRD